MKQTESEIRIEDVKVIAPYTLVITWKNGHEDSVDMEGVIHHYENFAPLRDPDTFASVRTINWGHGIEWENGIDYSRDSLAFLAQEQNEMTAQDMKAWQNDRGLSNAEAADWMDVALSTWKTYITPGKRIPRPVQIAARAAADHPGLFSAHFKPRKAGRPKAAVAEKTA